MDEGKRAVLWFGVILGAVVVGLMFVAVSQPTEKETKSFLEPILYCDDLLEKGYAIGKNSYPNYSVSSYCIKCENEVISYQLGKETKTFEECFCVDWKECIWKEKVVAESVCVEYEAGEWTQDKEYRRYYFPVEAVDLRCTNLGSHELNAKYLDKFNSCLTDFGTHWDLNYYDASCQIVGSVIDCKFWKWKELVCVCWEGQECAEPKQEEPQELKDNLEKWAGGVYSWKDDNNIVNSVVWGGAIRPDSSYFCPEGQVEREIDCATVSETCREMLEQGLVCMMYCGECVEE